MPDSTATVTDLIDHVFEVLRHLQTSNEDGLLTEVESKAVQSMMDAGLSAYGDWFLEDQPEG